MVRYLPSARYQKRAFWVLRVMQRIWHFIGSVAYLVGWLDGVPKKVKYCPMHGLKLRFDPTPICNSCAIEAQCNQFSKSIDRWSSDAGRQDSQR